MNTTVPDGWIELQLLNNSGNPWQGVTIKNGRLGTTDRHGRARLHMDGGPIDANGVPVKKLIESVKDTKEVILQFNSDTGGFRIVAPKTKNE